jgi:hypothetical protein
MATQTFRFKAAPLVPASFTLDGDTLVYQQGLRRTPIALAKVRTFAIRERPAFLGFTATQLLFELDTGDPRKPTRMQRTMFDPKSPECRALVEALHARFPAADATKLPWAEAAGRLGVVARPWYEGFTHPRSMIGMILLGANGFAVGTMPATRDSAERFGQGIVTLTISVLAILLLVSGFRRTRAKK